MQRPLAAPGPDYKVQGWFFICTSSVCASMAGVTADWLRPPALTAPTCAHLLLTGEVNKIHCRIIKQWQPLFFVQSADRSAHFSFSCAEVKSRPGRLSHVAVLKWKAASVASETSLSSCMLFLSGGVAEQQKRSQAKGNAGRKVCG